jgi:hypothetical protein
LAFSKTPVSLSSEEPFIVIETQKQHIGAMMGHISNGGGQVAIGENYAIRFIRDGSPFVTLELIQYSKKSRATTQTWSKTKTILQKPTPKKTLTIKTEEKEEELF